MNALTCQICGYIFVNMHLKLLLSETWFFSPKCSKYRSAGGLRLDPLGSLDRSLRHLAGLRDHTSKGREGEEK